MFVFQENNVLLCGFCVVFWETVRLRCGSCKEFVMCVLAHLRQSSRGVFAAAFVVCGVRFGLFFGRSSISSRLSHLDDLAADAAAAREFADIGAWLAGEGNEFYALFFCALGFPGHGSLRRLGRGKCYPSCVRTVTGRRGFCMRFSGLGCHQAG